MRGRVYGSALVVGGRMRGRVYDFVVLVGCHMMC